jgi:hypothetical protein
MTNPSFMVLTKKLILASLDANGRVIFPATSTQEPPVMLVRGNTLLLQRESPHDHSNVNGLSVQSDAQQGGDQ